MQPGPAKPSAMRKNVVSLDGTPHPGARGSRETSVRSRVCRAVLWQRIARPRARRSCGARSRGYHRPPRDAGTNIAGRTPKYASSACRAGASRVHRPRRTPRGARICQPVLVSVSQLRRSRWRPRSRRGRRSRRTTRTMTRVMRFFKSRAPRKRGMAVVASDREGLGSTWRRIRGERHGVPRHSRCPRRHGMVFSRPR
jgi:hypothetical protein